MNKYKLTHKAFFLIIISTFILSACAPRVEKYLERKELNATYYIWSTGVAPAGTGMNCRIAFSNPKVEIHADSLLVNDQWFDVETVQEGDSTIIQGTYYIAPDFEKPNSTVPDFFTQEKYSGKVKLTTDQKSFWLTINQLRRTKNKREHV